MIEQHNIPVLISLMSTLPPIGLLLAPDDPDDVGVLLVLQVVVRDQPHPPALVGRVGPGPKSGAFR